MTESQDGTFDKLRELAGNLWWSWQPDIRAIFRELEPESWSGVYHNPVALLQRVDPEEIYRRVRDLEMQTRINQAHRRLRSYLEGGESWGLVHAGPILARPVAYFSAEFGLHQSLPIYSGGLGVLAGDHLKSMSDLGAPVVGIGLLYHQGYVHQLIDADGWQQDLYEPIAAAELPVEPVLAADGGDQARFSVELPGRNVFLRVWRVRVGRSDLLLLDARDEANAPEDRELTARLYGGDQEMRIQQEILLGVGGHRALGVVGIRPSALHLNEGHSAFALLERAREIIERQGVEPAEALREVAAMSVFTTHTPVEAGHDRFRADLAGPHLEALARGLGMPLAEVLALGSERPGDPNAPFCPTVLALKLTRRTNAVSALHGRVSRKMWQPLYPGKTEDEVPIGHITNGVHVRTWLSADMHGLYIRYLGPRWLDRISFPDLWTGIDKIPDAELWEVHQVLKARLIAFARGRMADRRQRLGLPQPAKEPLDPDTLTLGFARRFATYKRADLLFQDLDRFAELIGRAKRPLQIVYAGKAHPRDTGGKALAQRVANLEKDPRFAGRVVFIEDYSMHVGRQLVQGVDVWLNTPRRPLEACGTSGQKGILNGTLNCSILDGWWAEAYDGGNGFAIGGGEIHANPEVQDERDAESLFETLEREVIPLYYERDAQGIPTGWIRRVKRAIRTLAWRYNADRMVMDYVKECYLPAAGGVTCRM
ncbi:MAG TPA: alpha-glucan family phosphorylase [Thermoanaerobaculia bacterium]|jgi:starch phosphorylase|nr:alpha-glucan family phosphorylase [Thermoanaerobaculia bacterium]